jgi:hypothetical protein
VCVCLCVCVCAEGVLPAALWSFESVDPSVCCKLGTNYSKLVPNLSLVYATVRLCGLSRASLQCARVCEYIYVCIHTYIFIYKYAQRERERVYIHTVCV